MRSTWPLALVIIASFGCGRRDAPAADPNGKVTSGDQLEAPVAMTDALVKDLCSRTGIPVYPDSRVDQARSQAYQHLGEIDQYTVPLTSADPFQKVSSYYIKVLGGSYSGTPSSGKLTSKLATGGTVTISMEKSHDSGTTILLYASLPNSKPIQASRPAQETPVPQPNQTQQMAATATPAEQPQPTFRVNNPSIDNPTQPDVPLKESGSGG